MAYEQINYTTTDALGIITLNNPGKINALSKKMIAEISAALQDAADALEDRMEGVAAE